jgi:hypothetical protein
MGAEALTIRIGPAVLPTMGISIASVFSGVSGSL